MRMLPFLMLMPAVVSAQRLEVTVGAGSTAGTGNHGQFPALAVSLAANLGFSPRMGAALVGDATAALFTSALMAGAKIYARTAPLHSRRRVVTVFGQLLAGRMRAETSGVVHSTGGFAWQPGGGIEYGGGSRAVRVQIDYAFVRDGYVFDDRVTSGPVNDLTGTRVLIGFAWRASPW